MKYFLHDTNAFNDEKITELYIRFGYEGIGLFYSILEKIAMQEKPVKTIVLKKQLEVGKRLEKCWKFMEEIGLIHSNNGDTFNKQLLNFSEKYQIKKEKNAKKISEWREKQKDTENVTSYENVCNSPKVNKSKVNRSKVNNNTDSLIFPFLSDEFINVWDTLIKQPKWKNKSKDAFQMSLDMLGKYSQITAIEMMQNSIRNNYQGVFEIKHNNQKPEPESKAAKTLSDFERLTMAKVEQTRREEELQNG